MSTSHPGLCSLGGVSSLDLTTAAVRPENSIYCSKSRNHTSASSFNFPSILYLPPLSVTFPFGLLSYSLYNLHNYCWAGLPQLYLSPLLSPLCLEGIWLQGISMCKRHAKPDWPCLYSRPKVRGQHTTSPSIFKCYGLAHFHCTPDLDLPLYFETKM